MEANEIYDLTPKDAAKMLGVPYTKALAFISAGDLRAIDTSNKPGSGRPRWRLSRESVSEFVAKRSNASRTTPAEGAVQPARRRYQRRRPRRSTPQHV